MLAPTSHFYLTRELSSFFLQDSLTKSPYTNNILSLPFKKFLSKRVYFKLRSELVKVNVMYAKYKILTEFIEANSGRKSCLRINPTIENSLTFEDVAQCLS